MSDAKLVLYHRIADPNCAAVRSAIMASHYRDSARFRNVDTGPEAHADLLQLLDGKDQVPCLVVGDKIMTETAQILAWLKG